MGSVACKNDKSACPHFLMIAPDIYFYSFPERNSTTINTYLNVTLEDYKTCQCPVSHARMISLFVFIF